MPFDITDKRLSNFLQEERDEVQPEDVEDIDRNRRNFISFVEDTAKLTFIGVSVGERSFDEDQLEKTIDTEITELS